MAKTHVLTTEELSAIQLLESEMLRMTVEICDRLGLKYYLLGGTLLGAVRHGGFIPWDDDIDIGMPRDDYEVFLSEAQKYYPDGYFVQHLGSEENLPISFCKIRNSNTAFMESTLRKIKINKGVFIDIFPLDRYPDAAEEREKINKFNLKSQSQIIKAYAPVGSWKQYAAKWRSILKHPFISYKKAARIRDERHKKQTAGNVIANYNGAWGIREYVPAEWYGEGEMLDFAGISCRVPKEYKKWLAQVYGDYMKLPPEEKRTSHHHIDAIDFNKSYKEYEK